MEIRDDRIDSGKAFDWGKTADEYARYRDIYPEEFYRKITDRKLCVAGQNVLDLGTGTGVLPRHLYRYGATWTGIDISPEQIYQAKRLAAAAGMEIDFRIVSAEDMAFPDGEFDVITACQCFWYFDHEKVMSDLARILKPGGKLLILYMAWLPDQDTIAARSEQLVLKYNPYWAGAGEKRHPNWVPDIAFDYFEMEDHEEYDLMVPFTRESWHGRMKACRGTGASLTEDELAHWEAEHRALLEKTAPDEFEVLHFAALTVLRKKAEQSGDKHENDRKES